jgi:hypothetical protein
LHLHLKKKSSPYAHFLSFFTFVLFKKQKYFVSRASLKRIPILLVVLHLKLVNALHLKEKLHSLHTKRKEFVVKFWSVIYTLIFSEELHFHICVPKCFFCRVCQNIIQFHSTPFLSK